VAEILTGTASWTDPTLLAADWYPREAESPEDRLRFYASRFPLVEVDSTYYSLPSEATAVRWVDRTPDDFTFDFKAFRLFTGHPTPVKALPRSVRESLPRELAAKTQLYAKDLPGDAVSEVWNMYRQALMPVHSAGKLGAVFLQFPKWFYFGRDNLEVLAQARDRLPDYGLAVEFRQPSWLHEKHRDETLRFLREHGIAYTSVDEPQGTSASVPPVAEATTELAVVRFHGRKADTWDKRGVGVTERFKYLYDENELSEWVPKIETLSRETDQVHVLMNNCYADYGVRNAQQLAQLLTADGAQVRRPDA
jgi:uncharacterized protein YecE (DUF72 family)